VHDDEIETRSLDQVTAHEARETVTDGRRQYKNPPIREALCEIHFVGGAEWDFFTPTRLYEALRSDYPAEPRQRMQAGVQLQANEAQQGLTLQTGGPLVHLLSEDETRQLTAGSSLLVVHTLAPYEGWERFQERIATAVDRYTAITQADAVERIGVRYINQINIPRPSVRLEEYFTAPPRLPDDLAVSLRGFFARIEAQYDDGLAKLIQTIASVEAEMPSFILDLDVVAEFSEPLNGEEVMPMIDELRRRERIAFEQAITELAREQFDA